MLRRNGPVTKSVESVQRPEESQRLERLVQGFERGNESVRELWMVRVAS